MWWGLGNTHGIPCGMHPPALAPHSASLFELCLNVVCTEAATWGRWPQIVQAHLFPQNVPQHGCEATAAAVDPLCKATVFQEHSWALFHVGIRSLLQIKDFLLCICGKKVWVSFIPCLLHLAWDPVYYHVVCGLTQLLVLSNQPGRACQCSQLLPGLLCVFTVKLF